MSRRTKGYANIRMDGAAYDVLRSVVVSAAKLLRSAGAEPSDAFVSMMQEVYAAKADAPEVGFGLPHVDDVVARAHNRYDPRCIQRAAHDAVAAGAHCKMCFEGAS